MEATGQRPKEGGIRGMQCSVATVNPQSDRGGVCQVHTELCLLQRTLWTSCELEPSQAALTRGGQMRVTFLKAVVFEKLWFLKADGF